MTSHPTFPFPSPPHVTWARRSKGGERTTGGEEPRLAISAPAHEQSQDARMYRGPTLAGWRRLSEHWSRWGEAEVTRTFTAFENRTENRIRTEKKSTSFFLESSAFCASTMSPTDSKRCGAKRRKNKKGTCLVQSNLDSFEIKSVETASSVATPSTSSPSTSSVGISFQAIATVSSPSTRNGLLAATATAVPRVSSERKTEVPKKRCGGTINSRQTCKRSRIDTSDGEAASQAEPIDLEENTCEEVVDLTCESSEPVVVDLTRNDSVVIVEENACHQQSQELRSQQPPESCILSSDDDESRDNDVVLTSTLPRDLELLEDRISSTRRSGTVSCPICMDGYSEIVQSGRLIVSTKCGHVFCSQCLRDSLRNANSCPTCRKKLGYKQYHPIYI